MKRLARAINAKIDQAAFDCARPLNDVADGLGETLQAAGKADRDGSGPIIAEIRGADEYGEPAVFSPDRVVFDVLRDRHGPRGIGFPTKSQDKSEYDAWTRLAGEKIDREFNHFWPASRVHTRELGWERDPYPQPLPNTGNQETGRGILVISHANPHGFAVKVRTEGPPNLKSTSAPLGTYSALTGNRMSGLMGHTRTPRLIYPSRNIFLGGAEYGRLLAAKKPELDAAAETPDSPIRMISCSAGSHEGDAAESAAASLRANGVDREVQAATDSAFLATEHRRTSFGHEADHGSSVIGIAGRGDSDGNILAGWRTFPESTPGPG